MRWQKRYYLEKNKQTNKTIECIKVLLFKNIILQAILIDLATNLRGISTQIEGWTIECI